ncbi:hypothetical protein BBP40_006037 [Aspergillus hancockii]|nr:hypothetical protein BBP40_006037 [Aspergillus hancockii]
MSDALCGPSNALQNFQKHASVDRTLQQDRLASRRSPSQAQGFRSQNSSEGILDPEFSTFESNLAGAPLSDLQHPGHFATPSSHFAVRNPTPNPDWAADFQRMQISGPSPLAHQQPNLATVSVPTFAQHGWQSEFINQQQQPSPAQQHQPLIQRFQPSFAARYTASEAVVNTFPSAQEMVSSQLPPTEVFDESAFEAAFEQAKADLASQTTDNTQDVANEVNQLGATPTSQAQETIKIGSDTIPPTSKDDVRAQLNDADELARTAGQLLQSVSHDQSQKFRESNFLALMRRIRDREVHVEGDEFRETSQPLHPGGKYYPEGKTRTQQGQSPQTMTQDNDNNSGPFLDSVHRISTQSGSTIFAAAGDETSKDVSHATAIGGLGTGDGDSLYEGWRFGDRWA